MQFGRMDTQDQDFMKIIIENCFIKESLRQRFIVVVTHSPRNHISNFNRAQDWISTQSSNQNSPLQYFFSLSGGFEFAKSRIHLINCKNPNDEEEPGKHNERLG